MHLTAPGPDPPDAPSVAPIAFTITRLDPVVDRCARCTESFRPPAAPGRCAFDQRAGAGTAGGHRGEPLTPGAFRGTHPGVRFGTAPSRGRRPGLGPPGLTHRSRAVVVSIRFASTPDTYVGGRAGFTTDPPGLPGRPSPTRRHARSPTRPLRPSATQPAVVPFPTSAIPGTRRHDPTERRGNGLNTKAAWRAGEHRAARAGNGAPTAAHPTRPIRHDQHDPTQRVSTAVATTMNTRNRGSWKARSHEAGAHCNGQPILRIMRRDHHRTCRRT
jgi:hypothetical protein